MRSVRKLLSPRKEEGAEMNVDDSSSKSKRRRSRGKSQSCETRSVGTVGSRRLRLKKINSSRSASVPRQRQKVTTPRSSSRSVSVPRSRSRPATVRSTKSVVSTTCVVKSKSHSTEKAKKTPTSKQTGEAKMPSDFEKASRVFSSRANMDSEQDINITTENSSPFLDEKDRQHVKSEIAVTIHDAEMEKDGRGEQSESGHDKENLTGETAPSNSNIMDATPSPKKVSPIVTSPRPLLISPPDEMVGRDVKIEHTVKEAIDPTTSKVRTHVQQLKAPRDSSSVTSTRTRGSTRSRSSRRSRNSIRSRSARGEHCIEVHVSRAILQKCADASQFLKNAEESNSTTASATDILSDLYSVAEENGIDAVRVEDVLVPHKSWVRGPSDSKRERASSSGSSVGNASAKILPAASTITADGIKSLSSEATTQVHNLSGVLAKLENKRNKSLLERHLEATSLQNGKATVVSGNTRPTRSINSSPRLPPTMNDNTMHQHKKEQVDRKSRSSTSSSTPLEPSSTGSSSMKSTEVETSPQDTAGSLNELTFSGSTSSWMVFEDDSFKSSAPREEVPQRIVHQSQEEGFGDVVVYTPPSSAVRSRNDKVPANSPSPTCVREASWQADFAPTQERAVEDEKKEEHVPTKEWGKSYTVQKQDQSARTPSSSLANVNQPSWQAKFGHDDGVMGKEEQEKYTHHASKQDRSERTSSSSHTNGSQPSWHATFGHDDGLMGEGEQEKAMDRGSKQAQPSWQANFGHDDSLVGKEEQVKDTDREHFFQAEFVEEVQEAVSKPRKEEENIISGEWEQFSGSVF